MQSKLVVMLSTYNGEKYLEKQLQSIYNQKTDCSIQLFVRDDGSNDKTKQILHNWDEKLNITYIEDNESLGAAKSFWKLMKNVQKADYYAFVDQDDIWKDSKVETAVTALQGLEGPVLWFSNCHLIDENDKIVENNFHNDIPMLTVSSQLVCGSAQGCSMVFNREAYMLFKDKNIEVIPMHDIVIMEYILARGKVIYEETPLFSYRIHSNNVVAKQGKNFVRKNIDSLKRWFGKNNKYIISKFAAQILKDNREILDKETKEYLYQIVQCRKKIRYRRMIVNNKLTVSRNNNAVRSFKIRVLLGII